jgi:small subunit ribosomal protein S26
MNSLRRFLIQEVMAKEQSAAFDRPSAEDISEEIEINNQWNSEIAKMREMRLLDVKEKRKEQILLSLERQKERTDQRLNILNEKVKKIEQESKTFITRDLLDVAIEKALANPVSFDYCIDLKGGISYNNNDTKDKSPNDSQATDK